MKMSFTKENSGEMGGGGWKVKIGQTRNPGW